MRPSKRRILELERALQREQTLVAILERRIVDIRKRLPKIQALDAGGKIDAGCKIDAGGKIDAGIFPVGVQKPVQGVVAKDADGQLAVKLLPRNRWRPVSKYDDWGRNATY